MVSIEENVNLFPYNTFRVTSTARYLVRIRSISEIQELIHSEIFDRNKRLILGGGSNVLLVGYIFDGLVIKNMISGINIIRQSDTNVELKIGGGENWHALVMYCLDNDFGGIENLTLIPGTVGAAPVQNIGAYGVELKDVLLLVEAIELSTGKLRYFTRGECRFGYRESIFKNEWKDKYFISAVILKLSKGRHQLNTGYDSISKVLNEQNITVPTIQSVSEAVAKIRKSKLPNLDEVGSAGSFFKNPCIDRDKYHLMKLAHPTLPSFAHTTDSVTIPAAWLIELCRLKGKRLGNVGVYRNHALVLVNYFDGTGDEVLVLAADIHENVLRVFGISLIPEVNIIK
ncbi:UDP-N-acetylenolpyruvoylglucosamine reductase [Glonium stellatum]|uniref:UDP-N-acetylmuramate dehydrogenase n=1 Tax=Glonium stellatum TaxID=574774 RepID=A0A8E2EY17_9PEZI|nr:UDP-N-acetylenolpyruvoylglucosamine reductase [Glonium stellatum]